MHERKSPNPLILLTVLLAAIWDFPALAATATYVKTIRTWDFRLPNDPSKISPSPDPSGMAYLPSTPAFPDRDRLIVCDGEIDEMASASWAIGVETWYNIFEMDRQGVLLRKSATTNESRTGFANEPAGCAYNGINNHLYISDDDKNMVFDIDLGSNGLPDFNDARTSMSTIEVCGSGDPEGLGFGFDPVSRKNTLFIFDGTNAEVYKVIVSDDGIIDGKGETCTEHFDTASLGVRIPDAGEYDADNIGHLYLWGNNVSLPHQLFHITTAGTIVRSFDLSPIIARTPSGIATVPKSVTGDGATHIFLADRRKDNSTDFNENDGVVFEFKLPGLSSQTNQPPSVAAGPDQLIYLPRNARLNGSVSDDSLPKPPARVTTVWRKISGPGTVTFANALAVDTTASFSAPGTYILRLAADDDGHAGPNRPVVDTMTVTVNAPVSITHTYISTANGGTVGGIAFEDEDILAYNNTSNTWSLYFDGSDVGLGAIGVDVDAAHLIDADNSLLLSLSSDVTVTLAGIGTVLVDDSDILRFTPAATCPPPMPPISPCLGANTAGTFEIFFDGSDVGLTAGSEDIDAIGFLPTPDGRLVISTSGIPKVSDNAQNELPQTHDEDLLVFNAATLGADTSGYWELYFDATDAGLGDSDSEDVDGISIHPESGSIYMTTVGVFSVPGVTGDGNDLFVCDPDALGETSSCTFRNFWEGGANGLGSNNIDALDLR